MNNNTFIIDNEEYKIIKILSPSNSENKYLIYTDKDNEYYASRFIEENGNIKLYDIAEEYEWDYIDKRMEEILHGN